MDVTVHLDYDGDCEEAFRFYEDLLGGKIESMMRWDEMPGGSSAPPEMAKKIMHASMKLANTTLMGADAAPGRYAAPQGVTVSIGVESGSEAERIFAALAEGGRVTMPMDQTFFASHFGMCVDRFGIPWMVVCEKP